MSTLGVLDAIEDWFSNPTPVKPIKSRSNPTGFRPKKNKTAKGGGAKNTGQGGGFDKLKKLSKKVPQVMVKISGAGKGMHQTKNHIDYISRNGQLRLIDHDGQTIEGKQDVKDLKTEWRAYGVPEESNKRECFNIVLGMPTGTPPDQLFLAVQEFAYANFTGHKYVMALHEPGTDAKTKNPHVHICVVATDEGGHRLNPRKADLQQWREDFAVKLNERGIEALATTRRQHFNPRRAEKTVIRKMRETSDRPMPRVYRASVGKKIITSKGKDLQNEQPKYDGPGNWRTDRAAAVYKHSFAKTGQGTQTQRFASLRDLSSIELVHDKRHVEMLLPLNARNHVGGGDDRTNIALRRQRGSPAKVAGEVSGVASANRVTTKPQNPAQKNLDGNFVEGLKRILATASVVDSQTGKLIKQYAKDVALINRQSRAQIAFDDAHKPTIETPIKPKRQRQR